MLDLSKQQKEPTEDAMGKYSTIVQWSDEDEGYIATVPELPNISAFGETVEAAVRELEVAKQAAIEVYEEDGCPLPAPDKIREFSGQLRIRIPKSLHAELSREAVKDGVSLNQHISHLLSKNNEISKIEKQLSSLKPVYQVIQIKESQESWSGTESQFVNLDFPGYQHCKTGITVQ